MVQPYWTDADSTVQLWLGSSLDVLPTLADASVDAVVCDPPYELGFMGKAWDASGIAYNTDLWRQCWRVLKPGGHLLAFGGTRTYHRMTCAIEDAGFEIRDSLHWIYGGGFPKGIDVAKAVDRVGGSSPKDQAGVLKAARQRAGLTIAQVAEAVGCKVGSVRDWEDGRSRAKGREIEHVVPSSQYRQSLADLLGYSADERRIVGASPRLRDKDGPVFKLGYAGVEYAEASTEAARSWVGWNTALKPAHEPIVLARKALAGTVASTVLLHGTGAINVDACRTVAGEDYREKCASVVGIASPRNGDTLGEWTGVREDSSNAAGRWPTNVLLSHPPILDDNGQPIGDACADGCVPGCPVAEMDQQSGTSTARASARGERFGAVYSGVTGADTVRGHDDSGGASRFFPVFRYEAKASKAERPRLHDGTVHTTVKPVALMRWLIRLVTPPGGLVLDPFAGSGTTLEAAVVENFRAVGVELLPEHAELCKTRLAASLQPVLFA